MLDHPVPLPILALELPPQSVEALQAIALVVGLSVVVGYIGYVLYRRSVHGPHGGDSPGEVFTLADLRRLRREGHMTDEEFEQAKVRLLAMYKSAGPQTPPDEPEGVEDLGHLGGDDDEPAPQTDADDDGPAADDSREEDGRRGPASGESDAASENAAGGESSGDDEESDGPASGRDGGDDRDEGPQ